MKAKVWYEKVDPQGSITLAGQIKTSKVSFSTGRLKGHVKPSTN